MTLVPAKPPQRIVLEGRWARLEPLAPSHLADLASCAAPERYQWLFDHAPDSAADLQSWAQKLIAGSDPLMFAVIDRGSGRAEGRQSLMRIVPEHGVIEVGNILWGDRIARTRIATEALFLHARYVFDELGYRRFEWKCNNRNEPSKRAAQRFGFEFEGIFRQHMIVKGENRDTAWFAMLDSDWPRLRGEYERWLDPGNFDAEGCQRTSLRFD
jgi:RimJ/RimL family protein N-acetyltransferase